MGAIFHEEDDLYKCHSYYRFYLLWRNWLNEFIATPLTTYGTTSLEFIIF